MNADEHDLFLSWLDLDHDSRLLEVACGSGGALLRTAKLTGCEAQGIDIHEDAIRAARAMADNEGLADRVTFDVTDAGNQLPYPDNSFSAIICIDAINHLPDRAERLRDWARILRPGGRIVFTDPIVLTGPVSNDEIAVRSSIAYFLFVPPDFDDRLLLDSGFSVIEKIDRSENNERIARSWREAREGLEAELREIEGDETYDGSQRILEVAERLASERRLSRFAYCAEIQ